MLETGSLDMGSASPDWWAPGPGAVTVHREPFVLVVPAFHKLAKRKKGAPKRSVGQDFVMYERAYAPGFHDLIFAMLAMPGLFPMFPRPHRDLTLISLVDAHMVSLFLPRIGGQTLRCFGNRL